MYNKVFVYCKDWLDIFRVLLLLILWFGNIVNFEFSLYLVVIRVEFIKILVIYVDYREYVVEFGNIGMFYL